MVGLLMLATLLVYAVPSHAGLRAHHASGPAHDHVLADAHHHDGIAAADHEHDHEQAPCKESGVPDDSCCSVAQCVSMHGGIPAGSIAAFAPPLDRSVPLSALATPEGIGSDPALRPPCPII